MTTRALRVRSVDGLVLVEDLGRAGFAHLGVPSSGALDLEALKLANRLVGNDEGAAGLEILVGGFTFEALASLRVALTGAGMQLFVGDRAAPWGMAVPVPAGATVAVAPRPDALRCWLAVSGGVAVPPVLGSRSTDTLSGLGPGPLRPGHELPVGADVPAATGQAFAVPAPARPDNPVELRLLPGPDSGAFGSDPLAALRRAPYKVATAADRVALRLDGPRVEKRDGAELPSAGLVTGAVQVPGDGLPLIFLADHPTTGGYPVAAVVDDSGVRTCAQLRPGDQVRFV